MRWLALAALAPTAALASPSAEHGKQVFDHWCAPCHAAGSYEHPGTQALQAKYQGKLPAALEERIDLTADNIRYFVRRGVTVMPYFRKTEISDADLTDLAAYLAKRN